MDRIRLALTWRRLSKHLSRLQDAASTPLDVLELGYGRGVLLQKMIAAGYRVRGVERHLLRSDDSSPTITGATLYNTTAEECTLSESSYDLICAIHVVEHLTDPNTVFHKIVRALRPGGIFYCITPNAESYGLSLFRQYWWNLEDPTHYRFFSRRSLASMLCTAGFRAVQTNIVIEDSVTLEANSALRALSSGDQNHGILHTRVARAVSFALTPVMLLARLFMPRLSPSIEAIAIKGR
jgi:2-polyprenyl-3-methyl-5-hydroxy-6-metoxy-1,4-benzoquinol methylase